MAIIVPPRPYNIRPNRNSWQSRGLVAWWPFAEYGDARDMVSGTSLVNTGVTWVNDPEFGRVPDFVEASSDRFTATFVPQGIVAYPFSFSCWFQAKTAIVGNFTDLMSMTTGSNSGNWIRLILNESANAGGVFFTVKDATNNVEWGITSAYTVNTWHHAVGVAIDGDTLEVYVDGDGPGSEVSSPAPTTAFPTLTKTSLGCFNGASLLNFLDGKLFDCRMYNIRLTATQVANMFRDPWALWDTETYHTLRDLL